jgi:hypothetical protein
MMNLEKLFYMVYEHFQNTEEYHKIRLQCWENVHGELRKIGITPKKHPLYVDRLNAVDSRKFTQANERSECTERAIYEFCQILGIDQQKLYSVVRGILKWHDERDWQVCFPFTEKNNKTILEYLKAN